jgi:hypothetical protein
MGRPFYKPRNDASPKTAVLSPRHPSPGEHNSYAAYYEMNSLLKVGCLLKIIFFEDICLT